MKVNIKEETVTGAITEEALTAEAVTEEVMTDENLTLDERIAKTLCSYHVSVDTLSQDTKPIKFMMAGNGIIKIMKNPIGVFVAKTNTVLGLPACEEGLKLHVPKIPFNFLLQTIAFFRYIMKTKNNAESMVQFYFNPTAEPDPEDPTKTKQWILATPTQIVSGASIKFERNQEYDEKYILVADIHSHNTMGAYFSTVDDADEKETRIFGVMGHLNEAFPAYKFRISVGGIYKEIDITELFECPFDPVVEIPKDLISKVKDKPKPVYKTYKAPALPAAYSGLTGYEDTDDFGDADAFYSPGGYHGVYASTTFPAQKRLPIAIPTAVESVSETPELIAAKGEIVVTSAHKVSNIHTPAINKNDSIGSVVDDVSDYINYFTPEERKEIVRECLLHDFSEVAEVIVDEDALNDIIVAARQYKKES